MPDGGRMAAVLSVRSLCWTEHQLPSSGAAPAASPYTEASDGLPSARLPVRAERQLIARASDRLGYRRGPLWADTASGTPHRAASMRSTPIRPRKKSVGTFARYYREPRSPTPQTSSHRADHPSCEYRLRRRQAEEPCVRRRRLARQQVTTMGADCLPGARSESPIPPLSLTQYLPALA